MFELKNSHIPMYVLHDLYIEYNGLSAQIDFIVVTKKIVFVIECKNLFGNIEITSNGDFVRTIQYGKHFKKEGIYSPITQNKRHLELIKQIKADSKANFILKALQENFFYNFYKGIVVLANPKTVLNDKYAKNDIKEQVIRADQLIEYIKRANAESKELGSNDKEMYNIAQKLLKFHKDNPIDYSAKYCKTEEPIIYTPPKEIKHQTACTVSEPSDCQGELYTALRNWRYKQSQKENLKPYYIFYNTTLDELVQKKPKTISELRHISGFGEMKCQKYGEEIIKIIIDLG